jgi:hypothetical protein
LSRIDEPGRNGGLATTWRVIMVREVIAGAFQSIAIETGEEDCATAEAAARQSEIASLRTRMTRSASMPVANAKAISVAG